MEQDRLQTNRSTLEQFFRKLFIKNGLWSIFICIAVFCLFLPFYLKLTADQNLLELKNALGPSIRILVETRVLGYEDLRIDLSSRIMKDLNLEGIQVVSSHPEGWLCYKKTDGSVCLDSGNLHYYFRVEWAHDIYFVEAIKKEDVLNARTLVLVLFVCFAFAAMSFFLFLAVNRGIKRHISEPIESMWMDLNNGVSRKNIFMLEELQGLSDSVVEYEKLSRIKRVRRKICV